MLEEAEENISWAKFRPIKRPELVLFKMKVVFKDTGTPELSEEGKCSRRAADSAARMGGGRGRAACACPPRRPSRLLAVRGSRKAEERQRDCVGAELSLPL